MKTLDVFQTEEDLLMYSSLFDPNDGNVKTRAMEIERKIEFLESLSGKVSNRRSRRWLNDRLLMELVPRLNAEEIRGLFSPPPWASIIESHDNSSSKCRGRIDADKVAVMTAWHRIDCRTREALCRSFLSEWINGYEECLREFVKESEEGNVLVLHVQDPFHRLLLHGVCEFYNLVSSTVTQSQGTKPWKMTEIRKKGAVPANFRTSRFASFSKWRRKGFGDSFLAMNGMYTRKPICTSIQNMYVSV